MSVPKITQPITTSVPTITNQLQTSDRWSQRGRAENYFVENNADVVVRRAKIARTSE